MSWLFIFAILFLWQCDNVKSFNAFKLPRLSSKIIPLNHHHVHNHKKNKDINGYTFGLPRYSNYNRMKLSMTTMERPPTNDLPVHSDLVVNYLDNGLKYVILPNKVPGGRFEAHLEVLSGSAFELESQQGMAHLLEHVVYMGSPKRQLISGTGSRTNAYTDFHHTVFFAACPTQTPEQFWKKPMLPMAFDALLDVMTTTVDDERMEKERAAVLSEASMVNKMEYRVECQVLGSLHDENRISRRFPIGKEDLIKSWTKQEVQFYHSIHYRPDNVILYVVGDVEVGETEKLIKQKFGSLKPKVDATKILEESGEFPSRSMHEVNPHFPPVVHDWSCNEATVESLAAEMPKMPEYDDSPCLSVLDLARDAIRSEAPGQVLPKPVVYKHELLQSFSFHLFAKRPIEPITSFQALRRDIIRRMTLSALQIRFNVEQRQDPLFTFVDFNQLNWPREGCAVCSLDLTTDPSRWKAAVTMAVSEIRRLGLYGLTMSELERYKLGILSEAEQFAAQSGQMGNEDVLQELMEAEACGHTLMMPEERLEMTYHALESITIDDVNIVAKELCEHLSHISPENGIRPAAVVACAPLDPRHGEGCDDVSEEEIQKVILDALQMPLQPREETEVPTTLITEEELQERVRATSPSWLENKGSNIAAQAGIGLGNFAKFYENSLKQWQETAANAGIMQRQLSNGMSVNLVSIGGEPQRANVRLYIPGGRMFEDPKKPGAVYLGSRTIQEGGAFTGMSREAVELFCIDHMVMVDIQAAEDALIFDFQTVTVGNDVTGLEAVMQVAHIIMTDFLYENDAFARARQSFHEQYDSVMKGLETNCQETLMKSLTNDDTRMATPDHDQIECMDLETAEASIKKQLRPEVAEVSIAGDAPMDVLEELALKYLGTIPSKRANEGSNIDDSMIKDAIDVKKNVQGFKNPLQVYLSDSDPRAVGYIGGPCPNRWGIFPDGSTVGERMSSLPSAGEAGSKEDLRRRHPLFGHAVQLVLQEVANRRLFSVVREERRLTYDASFQLKGSNGINGGWYMVSVTSSPSQVEKAVEACRDSLRSLTGPFGVMGDSVQAAKRTIINKFRAEMVTNKFWVDSLCGSQLECMPNKNVGSILDFENVLANISVKDVQLLVELLDLTDDNMTACIGISAPENTHSQPKITRSSGIW